MSQLDIIRIVKEGEEIDKDRKINNEKLKYQKEVTVKELSTQIEEYVINIDN
jgi:hypothetical protein